MALGTSEEREKFKVLLSKTDLAVIKENLRLTIYGNDWKQKIAQQFIENEEKRSDEQYKQKQIEISTEAVNVAKEANTISKEANTTSNKAFWISILSAVVAIIAVVINYFNK